MKSFLISLLFLNFFVPAYAQNVAYDKSPNTCGTSEYMEIMRRQDPNFETKLRDLEQKVAEYIKNNPAGTEAIRTIPVVVHVLYKTPQQNIPDTQIVRQIEILNQCFSGNTSNISEVPFRFAHLIANSQIQFCLAKKDPKNKPTSGITRTYTNIDSFPAYSSNIYSTKKGGKDAWPRDKYFNIWVCNNEGWLCFAQYPGGPAASDGAVMDFQIFGIAPNNVWFHNTGRVLVHEAGHWLGLRHIWGDDDGACTGTDYVDDTPNQANWINGIHDSSEVIISCGNEPHGAMWMNFMDYTWGKSLIMFSLGQSARMDGFIATDLYRNRIVKSTACNGQMNLLSDNDENKIILSYNYPNPFNPVTSISFSIPNTGHAVLSVYNTLGGLVETLIDGNITAGLHSTEWNASSYPSGIYFYTLRAGNFTETKKMLLIK